MMRKPLWTVAFVATAISQLGSTGPGGCGTQVLRDPGFDLWCGDQLCAWTVERGEAKRVGTWNEGDSGVELVGDDVAIAQLSPVTSSDGHCIKFDVVANVDDTAEVNLEIDVFGDGTVDHTDRIPTSHWQPLTYRLPIAGTYAGIKFVLTKKGTGTAVLANIGANTTTDCDGLTPIAPGAAPLGAPCTNNSACKSGMCRAHPAETALPFGDLISLGGECVACDLATQRCAAGDTCGLADPVSPVLAVPVECEPKNMRELGEQCHSNTECASGMCNAGMCSTCSLNSCASGESCDRAWPGTPLSPYVCAPNAHRRSAGEPCASNKDCASGSCAGAERKQCDDGRACSTAADCPFATDPAQSGLKNGPCSTVGVQGGICQ